MNDNIFMKIAIQEAKKAFKKGEVPVGAVLVKDGKILSRAHNQIEKKNDATAHAEVLCIRKASLKLSNWRLSKTTLYTTLEPCSMCAGSLLLSRVGRVVWGAPDLRHGAGGSFVGLLQMKHPTHQIILCKGVLEGECAELMREFFKVRRKKK